jgi:dUTP pyrophosphatase
VKLDPRAIVPKKLTIGSAGFDLYACFPEGNGTILEPQERTVIKTGVKISFPAGWYGRIAPRSGLALKYGIDVLAGTVDSDYRGEILVLLYNTGSSPYIVTHGERIAQIIPTYCGTFEAINVVDTLEDTTRGQNGFGSTGNK